MQNTKFIGTLVVGIIVGLLVAYLWLGKDGYNTPLNADDVAGGVNAGILNERRTDTSVVLTPEAKAGFTVEMQLAGDTAVIKDVVMPESGWVVVHEVVEGVVANALGATRLDAGEYDMVIVELLRPSIPESAYIVSLYSDNGNREFEIHMDTPIIGSDGNAIFKTFETASGSAN